jgi:hypothetical protein
MRWITCRFMIQQIQAAIENPGNLSKGDQEKLRTILQKYVRGEIKLDEAYFELLDNELIPMPKRCGMHAEPERSAKDEENLKEYINREVFDK